LPTLPLGAAPNWDKPPPSAIIENGDSLDQMNDKKEQQDSQEKLNIMESSQMESLGEWR
jgi:hypothetical protein